MRNGFCVESAAVGKGVFRFTPFAARTAAIRLGGAQVGGRGGVTSRVFSRLSVTFECLSWLYVCLVWSFLN